MESTPFTGMLSESEHSTVNPGEGEAEKPRVRRRRTRSARVRNLDTEQLAVVLRHARDRAQLGQKEICKRLKISTSTYSQWESGTHWPGPIYRAELSKILDIPYTWLMPGMLASGHDETVVEPDEQLLLKQYRQLLPPERQAVQMLFSVLLDRPRRHRS